MMVVLGVVLFLLRETNRGLPARKPSFDPDAVVRVFDISRVYRIRRNGAPSGELWFACAEGIRMLDPATSEWTRYGLDHGLPGETISDICFAGGTVWAGTWNGPARLDGADSTFRPAVLPSGTASRRVLAIAWIPGAGVFFSIDGEGLFRVPPNDSTAARVTAAGLKTADRITCLKEVDGALVAGAEGGRLLKYDPVAGTIHEIPRLRTKTPKTLLWDVLRHNGRLWAATSDDGLWVGGGESDTLKPVPGFPAKGAYCFAEESDGFWCGTPFGLWRYHDEGEVWVQMVHPAAEEPTDFQVFTLANTADMLWYGSMDLGAGFLNKIRIDWVPMRAGLSNPYVGAFAADDSLCWAAYSYQGGYVDEFRVADVQYERNYGRASGIGDPRIQVLRREERRLYYGGYEGFGYRDITSPTVRHFDTDAGLPHGDVADILIMSPPPHYLATLNGIVAYFPRNDSFAVLANTERHRVTSIAPRGDSLWYGTLAEGLRVYNRGTERIDSVYLRATQRVMGLAHIDLDDGGEAICVGTKTSGCHIVDCRSGELRKLEGFAASKGQANRRSHDIMTLRGIDGRVWLGTRNAGCFVFDPAGAQWYHLGYYDGLVSDRVGALYATRRYVWIGCYGGFNRIEKKYLASKWGWPEAAQPSGTESDTSERKGR